MNPTLSSAKTFFRTLVLLPLAIVVLLLTVLVSSSLTSANTSAAAGDIAPPFDTGSAWNVCQGYNNTRGTHNGTSSLSLDISGGPSCDNSASGRNVRAPFAGVVSWYVPSSGSLCLTAANNKSVMLTHIDSSAQPKSRVTAGEVVGSIAAPGARQNNGVSHLHYQAWSTPGCSDNSKRIPFSSAEGMRICGAPDLTIGGPNQYNNGEWSGTSFIAQGCGDTKPAVYRLFSTTTRKHLFTADANETVVLKANGWQYEGMAYSIKSLSACNSNESVYRFYSEQLKTHLYTIDEYEKNQIIANYPSNVWRYEGVAFCAASTNEIDTKPVYRFYSEQLKSHLFTIDENEKNTIIGWNDPAVWRYEGVSYYALPNSNQ